MSKIALAITVSALLAWLIVAPNPAKHTVNGPHTFCDDRVYCRVA